VITISIRHHEVRPRGTEATKQFPRDAVERGRYHSPNHNNQAIFKSGSVYAGENDGGEGGI